MTSNKRKASLMSDEGINISILEVLEKIPLHLKYSGVWKTFGLLDPNLTFSYASLECDYNSYKNAQFKFYIFVYVLEDIREQKHSWSVRLIPRNIDPEEFYYENFFTSVDHFYEQSEKRQVSGFGNEDWQKERLKGLEEVLSDSSNYHPTFQEALLSEFNALKVGLTKVWLNKEANTAPLQEGYSTRTWSEIIEVLADISKSDKEQITCEFFPVTENLQETIQETSKKNINAHLRTPFQNHHKFWLILCPTNDLQEWYLNIEMTTSTLQKKVTESYDSGRFLEPVSKFYGSIDECVESARDFLVDFVAIWLGPIVEIEEKLKSFEHFSYL
jgi:hypothetical protein